MVDTRTRRLRRCAAATTLALALSGAAAAAGSPASAAGSARGAEGSGDPYFPYAGNGGYDVQHYDLDLRYTPPADPDVLVGRLDGVATLTLTAEQDLDTFDLDLRGLRVRSVRVDGAQAGFSQVQDDEARRWEVVVRPAERLRAGRTATVVVSYGGRTGRPEDTTGALYGFVTTADGAIVANEPDGASTWFPVDDDPGDKATYSFRVDVPEGKTAVANGLLRRRRRGPATAARSGGGRRPTRWPATSRPRRSATSG